MTDQCMNEGERKEGKKESVQQTARTEIRKRDRKTDRQFVGWLVDCLLYVKVTPDVSQGRICSDKCTCCHIEIEVAQKTFHLTQPHYTDTEPANPNADPITPGSGQGSHWSTNG